MSDTYRIVLTGILEPGRDRAGVIDALVRLFRIPRSKADDLLSAGETVIKQNVDADTAERYVQALRDAGAGCRADLDPTPASSRGRDSGDRPGYRAPARSTGASEEDGLRGRAGHAADARHRNDAGDSAETGRGGAGDVYEADHRHRAGSAEAGRRGRAGDDDDTGHRNRSRDADNAAHRGRAGDDDDRSRVPPSAGDARAASSRAEGGRRAARPVRPLPEDPYAPPAASLVTERDGEGPHEPAGVDGARGLGWVVEGARMFAGAPLAWVLITVVYGGIVIVGSTVPIVGALALSVLFPVFVGGIMLGADRQHHEGTLQLGDLFRGFGPRLGPLAALGGIYLGGSIGIVMVIGMIMAAVLGTNALILSQMAQDGASGPALAGTIAVSTVLAILVMLGCLVPLYMALWFAPVLVALHPEIGVGDALRLSFRGCLRNVLGFLLYGIAAFVLLVIAIIPLGLGLLVASPVLLASVYVSYREIYLD